MKLSRNVRIFTALLIGSVLNLNLRATWYDRLAGGGDDSTRPLLRPLDYRHKQLRDLEKNEKNFDKEVAEARGLITQRINKIQTHIAEIESQLKAATAEPLIEALNKRQKKLDARRQNLIAMRDVWGESGDIIEKHIKILRDIIATLETKKLPEPVRRDSYNLKELKEVQGRVVALRSQIRTQRSKREGLLKKKRIEEESISLLLKDIDTENDELRKAREKEGAPLEEDAAAMLQEEIKCFEVTLEFLDEKKERAQVLLRKFDLESEFHKDLLTLLERQRESAGDRLNIIRNNLLISQAEINEAKLELDKAEKHTGSEKGALHRRRESKQAEKRDKQEELTALEKKLKEIEEAGTENEPESRVIAARKHKVANLVLSYEKEIELLDVKRDIEDAKVKVKELHYQLVTISHVFSRNAYERGELDRWFVDFTKARQKEENEIGILNEKRDEISQFITERKRKLADATTAIESLKEEGKTVYKGHQVAYNEHLRALTDNMHLLGFQTKTSQSYLERNSELMRYAKDIAGQYGFLIKWVEEKREFDIWRRSPNAISLPSFLYSLTHLKEFFKEALWRFPMFVNPLPLVSLLRQMQLTQYGGLLLLLGIFALLFFLLRILLGFVSHHVDQFIKIRKDKYGYRALQILNTALGVLETHYRLFFVWASIQLDILINFKRFLGPWGNFVWYRESPYIVTCFYLISIPILLAFMRAYIESFKSLNNSLDYAFFSQEFETKFINLFKTVLYVTVVLLPLRSAFISLYGPKDSFLPTVLLAAYTLVLQVVAVLLLFYHKDELLRIVPETNEFLRWLHTIINRYYSFIFAFFLLLLILSNPYIGYPNLAYLLLYAVPLTIAFMYGSLLGHYYIRKYSAFWFIAEDDDEVIDRFEYAKTYYGIFIILSFLCIAVLTFMIIAELWGVPSSLELAQYLLYDKWTLAVANDRIGLVEFVKLTAYIAGGFLISTLIDKFILNKIFDILRMDLGVRNTISSLMHYMIVYVIIIVGLISIHLGWVVTWVSGAALIGIGIASQDLLKDLVAGLVILLERPIEIGSFIETESVRGTVQKISPRSTTIRTVRNHSIVVPNKDLMNKIIANWGYGRAAVGFEVELLVAYGQDPVVIKALLAEVVQNDPRILRTPSVTYRVNEFGEYGMEFLIRAFISARRVREQWDIAGEMRMGILAKFKEHGIDIPMPRHDIRFLDGEGKRVLQKAVTKPNKE